MIVTPIKTRRLRLNDSLLPVMDEFLPDLKPASLVAITSKVISLCEGRVANMDQPLEEIVERESQYYFPADVENYNQRFTIIGNTLTARSGIDSSPKNNYYILWPKDPQATANQIRQHLVDKFGHKKIGVLVTDSVSTPLRRGVIGIAIAHSGFRALNDYRSSRANVAGGLAAAAVVAMGEGAELTPFAVIEDVPFVEFQSRNPTKEELLDLYISKEEDFFAPFINRLPWRRGGRS